MAARVRKRGAVADVRALVDQLGTPASRRKTDLSETEFAAGRARAGTVAGT